MVLWVIPLDLGGRCGREVTGGRLRLASPVTAAVLGAVVPGPERVLDVVVIAGTLISWAAWLAFQVPAYRRASGVHRQQLKWLYSGAIIS